MVNYYYDYSKIGRNYKNIQKQHENNTSPTTYSKAEIQIQLETD